MSGCIVVALAACGSRSQLDVPDAARDAATKDAIVEDVMVVVPPEAAPPFCVAPTRVILASGPQDEVWPYIAQDDLYIYFFSEHTGMLDLRRVLKCGGPVTTLASFMGYSDGLAVDDVNLYFTYSAGLARMPKAGGPVTPLVTPPTGPGGYALDMALHGGVIDFVYVPSSATSPTKHEIRSIPVTGGATSLLAIGTGLIDADDDWVYLTSFDTGESRLVAAPQAGGGPTVDLVQFESPYIPGPALRAGDGGIYFANAEGLNNVGSINFVTVGKPAKRVADNLDAVISLALDADYFYAAENDVQAQAAIWRWPKKGGIGTKLSDATNVLMLLVDAKSVYWTDSLHSIVKLDLP